jgi:hypothetical protein
MNRLKPIAGRRCSRGHRFAGAYARCPICSTPLQGVALAPFGRLRYSTWVRVSPEAPYRLGVVVLLSGERVLCRLEGPFRGDGRERVVLERRGETLVARRWINRGRREWPRRGRWCGRIAVRSATAETAPPPATATPGASGRS